MIDLCSGLGGASMAFWLADWEVLTVDNNKDHYPTILNDVRKLSNLEMDIIRTPKPNFVWASPPCTQFSRYSMANWYPEFELHKRGEWSPDMSIVIACKAIIDELEPEYWCIENVKGAKHFISEELGQRPRVIINNTWFLWGNFPLFSIPHKLKKDTVRFNRNPAQRSKVPIEISKGMLKAITQQETL